MVPNFKYSPNIWAKSVFKRFWNMVNSQQATVGLWFNTPPPFGQYPKERRFFWMSSRGGALRMRMWIGITMMITMTMTMSMIMMMVMTMTMMMTMTMQ